MSFKMCGPEICLPISLTIISLLPSFRGEHIKPTISFIVFYLLPTRMIRDHFDLLYCHIETKKMHKQAIFLKVKYAVITMLIIYYRDLIAVAIDT